MNLMAYITRQSISALYYALIMLFDTKFDLVIPRYHKTRNYGNEQYQVIYLVQPNVAYLYPLKTSENLWVF